MDKELRTKWIEALRSGGYKQGLIALNDTGNPFFETIAALVEEEFYGQRRTGIRSQIHGKPLTELFSAGDAYRYKRSGREYVVEDISKWEMIVRERTVNGMRDEPDIISGVILEHIERLGGVVSTGEPACNCENFSVSHGPDCAWKRWKDAT